LVSLFASCYYDKYENLYPLGNNTCDSSTVTYSGAVTEILSSYCYSCHNSSTATGAVILDTYADANTYALNGQLMGCVKGETGYPMMPPSASLNDCDIARLQKWVNDGAPDN